MRERLTEDAVDSPTPLSLASFSATVEQRQASLYGFLHGLLGDPEQARDLTQDTFHDAWRATQALTPPWTTAHDDDERRRWLFQVAYRRAISQLRRRKIIRWASLDWPGFMDRAPDDARDANVPTPLGDTTSFEQRVVEAEAMRAALARLTPDDAACLLLRVAQGFSAAEVASVLGVTTDAVAQRLSRARRRLRSVYLAQNPPDGADATDGAGSRNRGARAERSDGDE